MPSQRKTVLIISYSPLHRDPRILRQIQALKDDYDLESVGFTESGEASVPHFFLKQQPPHSFFGKILYVIKLMLHRYEHILEEYCNSIDVINSDIRRPDVIIANDWDGLWLAGKLIATKKWSAKVYFDAHEYEPRHFKSLTWRLFFRPIPCYVLKHYKKYISTMTTVCEGIAREYEKYLSFPENSIDIITNAPMYEPDLKPVPIGLYTRQGGVRLIHHGGAQSQRKLELMIDMMDYLDAEKYDLTFMLVHSDNDDYYDYLRQRAANHSNIHFIAPVPTVDISKELNKYDIGVYILPPTEYNSVHALPNKFFEYVQARLAIAIGHSVEMVNYVDKYQLGVYADSFEPKELAEKISSLSDEDIFMYKKNCDEFALELSAEPNIKKLRKIVSELEGAI